MILIIDNFDSFTYNIVQFVGMINSNIKVVKNNELTINEIKNLEISHIIISPGPGSPHNTGVCSKIIMHYKDKIPILGICLGHQLIAQIFGGEIIKSRYIIHGKTSLINIDNNSKIFKGLPSQIKATRYHSLILKNNVYNEFMITSKTLDNEIMSIDHKIFKIFGVQFHPESIKTDYGINIFTNFLKVV